MEPIEVIQAALNTFVPTFLVVGGAAFLVLRVWPWYTETYLPARFESQIRVAVATSEIARALEANTQAMAALCECIAECAQEAVDDPSSPRLGE